jgi:hypothetical protein
MESMLMASLSLSLSSDMPPPSHLRVDNDAVSVPASGNDCAAVSEGNGVVHT